MTAKDLKAIRARDDAAQDGYGEWAGDEQAYSMHADRHALLSLVDQLLEREKEARWLLQRASLNYDVRNDCNWNERRIAFLKATEGVK